MTQSIHKSQSTSVHKHTRVFLCFFHLPPQVSRMDRRRTRMTERLKRRLVGHKIKMTGEWAEMKLLLGRPERGVRRGRRGWRGGEKRTKRKEERPEERNKIDNSHEGTSAEETSDKKQQLSIRVYINRQFTRVQT